MSTPVPIEPEPDAAETTPVPVEVTSAGPVDHPDPITGEPHAHPVGVGVGAFSAGVAGAAIGAFAGPIGVVVGAAIGAFAGGLAGHEVAEEPAVSPTADERTSLAEFDHSTATGLATTGEIPLSSTLAERTTPAEDAFITGGTVGSHSAVEQETRLDDFDRLRPATTTGSVFEDDQPLPTASSGLVTPDESSFFEDSTRGESSLLTESPFPAARAVNAEGSSSFAPEPASVATGIPPSAAPEISSFSPVDSAAYVGHSDAEHAVRTSAYYLYLDRETTGQPGSDLEDWIKAEREILSR